MLRRILFGCVVCTVSLGFVLNAPASAFNNGSFESGNTSGWSTYIPPGGSIGIVSSHNSAYPAYVNYGPTDGARFALLKTDGPGSYTTLSQTITATAGEQIAGWAFFDAADYFPYNDNCQVQILSGSSVIATPFYASVSTVGNYGRTPWTYWTYTIPNTGTYTVRARIANQGDSSVDSQMGVDAFVFVNLPPEAHCKDITIALNASGNATIAPSDVDNGSFDPDGDPITLSLDITSFGCEDLGDNTVTLTATDDKGASATCTATVTVIDDIVPTVTLTLLTDNLWPPNHEMHLVAIGTYADNCIPTLSVAVTSNEPVNGTGDGDTAPDWDVVDKGDGTFDVFVRAERKGNGDGREYTIAATVTDQSNNSATSQTESVSVVHDQGKTASASASKGKGKKSGKFIVPGTANIELGGLFDGPEVRSALMPQFNAFALYQNVPNPFNPETVIRYSLSEASNVQLTIYNLVGQQVRVLVNESQSAGQYTAHWNGRDASGYRVTSGVYLYRLAAGSHIELRKMVLMK